MKQKITPLKNLFYLSFKVFFQEIKSLKSKGLGFWFLIFALMNLFYSLAKSSWHEIVILFFYPQVETNILFKWYRGLSTNMDFLLLAGISFFLFVFFSGIIKTIVIQQSLRRMGFYVGKDRIARLMREEGLKVCIKKAFRPKTTINNPSVRKSPREYKIESHKVTSPNQVWVSDLTYIPTEIEGFVYLVVVMDVFNREIKGWDLSPTMEAENTKNALINAIRSTSGKLNLLIFHTDQGFKIARRLCVESFAFWASLSPCPGKGTVTTMPLLRVFFTH